MIFYQKHRKKNFFKKEKNENLIENTNVIKLCRVMKLQVQINALYRKVSVDWVILQSIIFHNTPLRLIALYFTVLYFIRTPCTLFYCIVLY